MNLRSAGRRRWRLAAGVVWVLAVAILFDAFAYELNEFNTLVRVLLRTGNTAARDFDANGIPQSHSSRTGESFVSPFYVVHYGLLHSEVARARIAETGAAWRIDPSLAFWNVPPDALREEWFKNAADWVVEHVDYSQGAAHLLYDFDWHYPRFPGGQLRAPWWSGLTDGYAIILLLRAYDVYADTSYLRTAGALYASVVQPIPKGGSLNSLNGRPWIEEYVDPRVDPELLPFVLNGMIYATHGVEAYEERYVVSDRRTDQLYASIAHNIREFDLGYWSAYDAVGTANSIKYHRIHVALLADLARRTPHPELGRFHDAWAFGADHPLYFWLVYGENGPAKVHFVLLLLATLAAPFALMHIAAWQRARSLPDEAQ